MNSKEVKKEKMTNAFIAWGKTSANRPNVFPAPNGCKSPDIKPLTTGLSPTYTTDESNIRSLTTNYNNYKIQNWNRSVANIKYRAANYKNQRKHMSFNGGTAGYQSSQQNSKPANNGQQSSGHTSNCGNQWPFKNNSKNWRPTNDLINGYNGNKSQKRAMRRKKYKRNWEQSRPQERGQSSGQTEKPKTQSDICSNSRTSIEVNKNVDYMEISDDSSEDKSDSNSQQNNSQSVPSKISSAVYAKHLKACRDLSETLVKYEMSDEELMASLKYAIVSDCNGSVETAVQKIMSATRSIRLGAAYSIQHPKQGQTKWPSTKASVNKQSNPSTTSSSVEDNLEQSDCDIIEVKCIPASDSRRSNK